MKYSVLERLPIAGVLSGAALLSAAMARFPGGYRLREDTISVLVQAATPSGTENPARPLAVAAVLTTLGGIAVLFHLISRQTPNAIQRHTIQTAGIAACAFAALTITPLHDLMAGLALACFMSSIIAMLLMLYAARAYRLFATGIICLSLELSTGLLYFGQIFLAVLPIAQKAALVGIGLWLVAVQRRSRSPGLPRGAQV